MGTHVGRFTTEGGHDQDGRRDVPTLLTIAVCVEPGGSGSQGVRIFLSCWQSQADSEAVDASRDTFSDRGPLSLRGSRSNQVRPSWFHLNNVLLQDKTRLPDALNW